MYSIHICQLHQSSELLQWWPDCIMNLSCASSLTCSRLCRCYPLRKDCVDILVLWKWMNSIISVSPCESFWGVICLTAQILLPQMNGCFEAMMAVPAPHTHTHTRSRQMTQWEITSHRTGWLTLILDQGCIVEIQSQINIKHHRKGHMDTWFTHCCSFFPMDV